LSYNLPDQETLMGQAMGIVHSVLVDVLVTAGCFLASRQFRRDPEQLPQSWIGRFYDSWLEVFARWVELTSARLHAMCGRDQDGRPNVPYWFVFFLLIVSIEEGGKHLPVPYCYLAYLIIHFGERRKSWFVHILHWYFGSLWLPWAIVLHFAMDVWVYQCSQAAMVTTARGPPEGCPLGADDFTALPAKVQVVLTRLVDVAASVRHLYKRARADKQENVAVSIQLLKELNSAANTEKDIISELRSFKLPPELHNYTNTCSQHVDNCFVFSSSQLGILMAKAKDTPEPKSMPEPKKKKTVERKTEPKAPAEEPKAEKPQPKEWDPAAMGDLPLRQGDY